MKSFFAFVCVAFLAAGWLGSSARAFPQYYDISDHDKAQAEARQRNLPLAWLGSFPESLTATAPDPGSINDLTQMALSTLQGNAVVIFFDGRNMAPVPDIIHQQFHQQDDGPLPNGANWISPKVVFSNPEVTKTLGRVSNTQMKADRDVPLNSALQIIRHDPDALAPPASAAPASTPAPVNAVDSALSIMGWLNDYGLYLLIGVGVVVAIVCFWAVSRKKS